MKKARFILLFFLPALTFAQSISYPPTRQQTIIDTFYQHTISDPYRWLENTQTEEVDEWVDQQNKLTHSYLNKANFKYNSIKLIDKYAYTNYSFPSKHGDYYFSLLYYNNTNVFGLFSQLSLKDSPQLLVDPTFISSKDNIYIKTYSVSKDSKTLAYIFGRNGSDWGEIKVINLKTGYHLNDHLKQVKFSSISWKDDGFYYSKYPEQGIEQTTGQEVYLHKLGTSQEEDQLIFRRKNNPTADFDFFTTFDESYFILKEKDTKNRLINIFYINFNDPLPALRPLLTKLDADESLSFLDNQGTDLLAYLSKEGNNGMVLKIDPANPREWKVLIPEYKKSLLIDVKLLKDKILTVYLTNQKQQIVFFDYQGNVLHSIDFPPGYSVSNIKGEKNDPSLLFAYSGYTQPNIVYILDVENYELKPLKATVVNFDYSDYTIEEHEYRSKDSTMVPMLLIHKKDLDLTQAHPTLLKAYGGFGIISPASFNPGIVHFLMKGGIFAFANIRGGGDLGAYWWFEGRGKNKQNSFDDFICAAEFLIDNNYTTAKQLAITGASNGGLVVAAAAIQRPELFKAVVPIVAPLDMIRFEKFTIGHFHKREYGTVTDSVSFINLLSYSPLHNIKEQVNYPAMLIMTSENDDRVPPLHSYKFTAQLQNRPAQTNPIYLRVEKGAGHYGAFGSYKDILKEEGEMYNFILDQLLKDE
ncbi:MAG: prolyl oligopeptidase family protein [Prolixibacteraceae bacterium]